MIIKYPILENCEDSIIYNQISVKEIAFKFIIKKTQLMDEKIYNYLNFSIRINEKFP